MYSSKGYKLLSLAIFLILLACQDEPPHPSKLVDASTTEAREDSLALAAAYAGQSLIEFSVTASVETTSARASVAADAADDPAIWVHPSEPAKSLVFGSNKTGGLAAYDLSGEEVAYYPIGKINNVDILKDVMLAGKSITLLGCSNRTQQSIDLFQINEETGKLTDVAESVLFMDSLRIDDVYGFCLARSGESVYAIANGKNGVMQQFLLKDIGGKFSTQLVRDVAFPSQTEGMVADNMLGFLYVGEEAGGIFKLSIKPSEKEALPRVQSDGLIAKIGEPAALVADVEGLSIYERPDGSGYLLASMQGNFSYALFDRAGNNDYLGSFKIVDGTIDGVEETDGLEVVSTPLPGFPGGLLVVQDGFNFDGLTPVPQNFKYLDFGEVLRLLE